MKVKVLVAQSCPTFGPYGPEPARFLCPWNSPAWSRFSVPSPGDLPDLGLNLGLLHYRQFLYNLSHQGSSDVSGGQQ